MTMPLYINDSQARFLLDMESTISAIRKVFLAQGNAYIHKYHSIQGIPAFPRCASSMGAFAMEGEIRRN
jgi:ornithine cyclodeaminase/alanine dehydrogenase-like protein (mu-crystallin family)